VFGLLYTVQRHKNDVFFCKNLLRFILPDRLKKVKSFPLVELVDSRKIGYNDFRPVGFLRDMRSGLLFSMFFPMISV